MNSFWLKDGDESEDEVPDKTEEYIIPQSQVPTPTSPEVITTPPGEESDDEVMAITSDA